jgi:hypothetical protein
MSGKFARGEGAFEDMIGFGYFWHGSWILTNAARAWTGCVC